ncbi:hypothetical protein, partial [Bradyrhizobium ottawaense]|uniref:hypothetical protein n=1 Tax=Bradyrhizobium ottawaense TaxID=931866 RepID=UPI001BAA98B3
FLRVHFAQRTAGASQHPAFPAPSWIRGWSDEAKLGRIKPRGREGMSSLKISTSMMQAQIHDRRKASLRFAVARV